MNPTLPKPVPIVVAPAFAHYIGMLEDLDVFGDNPAQEGAGVRELLTAIHRVLSGGRVTVDIVDHGNATTADSLDALLALGIEETRQLNEVFDPGFARA